MPSPLVLVLLARLNLTADLAGGEGCVDIGVSGVGAEGREKRREIARFNVLS
jgi:hypothetical protein